jgi:hypothetical protein
VVLHSFTNGSVLLILGSLVIGLLASDKQAEGIKPFTNDIFKGFLAIFLLDMGITSGKNLKSFFSFGWFPFLFAVIVPLVNGCFFSWASVLVTHDASNRFIFGILAASASYIAVPAAMKICGTQVKPGLVAAHGACGDFPDEYHSGYAVVLADCTDDDVSDHSSSRPSSSLILALCDLLTGSS